jgi:quercetin dioxygenase-like cupin family protein
MSLQQPTRPSGKIPIFTPGNKNTLPPEVNIGCVANMFVRQMCFKQPGDAEQGHKHNFDHLTLLATGKLLVEVGTESTIFVAPAMIYINKDIAHKLIALEPNTVAYCIHGLRDMDISDDILSPEMIPNGVNMHKILMELRKR